MSLTEMDKHMDRILSLIRIEAETDPVKDKSKIQPNGWGFCIICEEDGDLKGLNEDHVVNGEKENYSVMLLSCFNIKFQLEVIEKSNKSGGICDLCIRSLKDAIIFKKQVEAAFENLQSALEIETNKYNDTIKDNKIEAEVKCLTETINLIDDSNSDGDDFDTEAPSTSLPKIVENTKPKPEIKATIQNTLPPLSPADTVCPMCDEKFPNHDLLSKHYSVHYMTFSCNICNFACVTKVGLLKHQASHSQKRFKCKICKKTYANRSAATQHVRSVHNGVKIYMCIECPERFSDYFARNQHMTQMHGVPSRTYICPNCGKDFNRSSRLSEHIRRDHIKIRRHACTDCDQKFFSSNELKEHRLKHSGIKNFHCNACGKSYARKKTLTEHLKIHANLRAHVCHICGKDFIQKCTLRSHLQTHIRDC